jgi:hypothetical protein
MGYLQIPKPVDTAGVRRKHPEGLGLLLPATSPRHPRSGLAWGGWWHAIDHSLANDLGSARYLLSGGGRGSGSNCA